MFYVIEKDGKFFSSGGGYVNSSGRCDSVKWVDYSSQAMGTSSLEFAKAIAKLHDAQVKPYK